MQLGIRFVMISNDLHINLSAKIAFFLLIDGGHKHIMLDFLAARTSHILQVACLRGDEVFNQYIFPEIAISKKAEEITGIKVSGRKMYHHDAEVPAVGIKEGLHRFLNFLNKPDKQLTLVGHNIKVFDIPVLLNALGNCNLVEDFVQSNVTGILDTLPLFKVTHPGLHSYSQTHLYSLILEESFLAHNAIEDVVALSRLLTHTAPTVAVKLQHTYTLKSTYARFLHLQDMQNRLTTLTPLLDEKAITKRTAGALASSGLNMQHLRLSYSRSGRQGIDDLLKECTVTGKPRVTKCKNIIDAVADYFDKHETK